MPHGLCQLRPGAGIHIDGLPDKRQIEGNTTIIDFLIDVVFIPDKVWYRKLLQPILNGHLGFNITDVITFKGRPFIGRVIGEVSGTLAVGFGRGAGLTEELDQFLALGELLLFQTEDSSDSLKRQRQPHRCCPDHGAAPAFWIQISGRLVGERMIVIKGIKTNAHAF